MAKKILSIEIGVNATRICLTDYKVKSPKVYKFAKFETPINAIVDGELALTEEYISLFKETLASNRFKCKQAIFTVSSSKIITREINAPTVKENKLEAFISANISDYFPVDLSQYEVGYTILGKGKENDKDVTRTQILVAPTKLIEGYQSLSEACGLTLVGIDYSGNSIYQMIKNDCNNDEVQLVMKVDEKSSILTFIKNQAIVLQRTIAYGIEPGIEAIQDQPVFEAPTYNEALELAVRKTCISVKGFKVVDSDEEDQEDSNTSSEELLHDAKQEVTNSFHMLIASIRRTMEFYSSRNQGEAVSKVYITGIGSDFSGLSKLLTAELEVKTVDIKHLPGQSFDKAFKEMKYGEYLACVGAAIAPIGFVTAKEKAAKGDGSHLGLSIFILVVAILGGGALSALAFLELGVEKANYELKRLRVESLADMNVLYKDHENTVQLRDSVAAMYNMTVTHNESLIAFIEEMEEKMPSNVRVTALNATLNNITFAMTATSKVEMANAIQELRNFYTVSSLNIAGATDEIQEDGTHLVTYTIDCVYKTFEELKALEEAEAASEAQE